jgi:hypothetical protein
MRFGGDLHLPGFAKPVGTGPVPGGTGPARYTNRSGSHPQTVPNIFNPQRTGRFDRYTSRFFFRTVGTGLPTVLLTLALALVFCHCVVHDCVAWARF